MLNAMFQTDVKYTSDGKTVWWPIPFPYTTVADVGVKTIDVSTGVETTLRIGEDYQIKDKHVFAVVPRGKQLEIWLTTSLDAVMPALPDILPHHHDMPIGVPGVGPAVPLPHPVPPLGDPFADRHLGVLSAEVMELRRQIQEGIAIERARECDGQVQRLKIVGKQQVDRMEAATDARLQGAVTTIQTTAQSCIDNLNATSQTLSNTAQTVYNSANAAQRDALITIDRLTSKSNEVKADLVTCESKVEDAKSAAAEARQYANQAVTSASDLDVAVSRCGQLQGQMAADLQIVESDKLSVQQMRDDVNSSIALANVAKTEIESHIVEVRDAATRTAVDRAAAETAAANAAADAVAARTDAVAVAEAKNSVEVSAEAVAADKAAVAADRAYVDSVKNNAEQAVHDVAVDMLTPGVVQDAANAAASAATAQAQQSADRAYEHALAAKTAKEEALAAQTATETSRGAAEASATAAATSAGEAMTRAQWAKNFAERAETAGTKAESEANRAESIANGLAGDPSEADFLGTYIEHFTNVAGLPEDANTDFSGTYEEHMNSGEDTLVPPVNPGNNNDPYNFVKDFEDALNALTGTSNDSVADGDGDVDDDF